MIVDDSLSSRSVLEMFFSKAGCNCVLVESGKQAIELLSSGSTTKFAIVLTDIQMPELDGFKTAVEIRKLGFKRPIVAMTASMIDSTIKNRALASGITTILMKPISMLQAKKLVNSYCKQKEAPATSNKVQVLDTAKILEVCSDDKLLAESMLSQAVSEISGLVSQLEEARNNSATDYNSIWSVAHTLKGSALALGLNELSASAIVMEERANANDNVGVASQVRRINSGLRHVKCLLNDNENMWLQSTSLGTARNKQINSNQSNVPVQQKDDCSKPQYDTASTSDITRAVRNVAASNCSGVKHPSFNFSEERIVILAIDDSLLTLRVLEAAFSKLPNIKLLAEPNVNKGIKYLKQRNQCDIVLLDVVMPIMSGYDACQKIRKKYTSSELPIILLSSTSDIEDTVHGFCCGANDFLRKPFSVEEICARIKNHISISKTYQTISKFVPNQFLNLLGNDDIRTLRCGKCISATKTTLFCDIRNFTGLSENLDAEIIFNTLNEFWNFVNPVFVEREGVVYKYIGDAIMVLFEEAEDCVDAAVAVIQKLNTFKSSFLENSNNTIKVGIGIHTGPLIIGIVGDANRMDSTAISDSVTVAERLKSMTKVEKCNILTTSETIEQLSRKQKKRATSIGLHAIVGRDEQLELFQITA